MLALSLTYHSSLVTHHTMAQVYHAKPLGTKLIEGATGGLIGALVVLVVMHGVDLLTPQRPWWSTVGLLGSMFVGTPEANVKNFDAVAYIVGLLVHFVIFALAGMGLVQYLPLFRRFKIDTILGGAIYGLIIYLTIYLYFFSVFKPGIPANMNNIALAIATVLGGAAMGWWLKRASQQTSTKKATT